MSYFVSTTMDAPFEQALTRTRESLAERGFGVLTEIDIAAVLKAKLGVDVPEQVILGACRPELAHQALRAEPSVGVLLPCNVVVRALVAQQSVVEAPDLEIMKRLAGNAAGSRLNWSRLGGRPGEHSVPPLTPHSARAFRAGYPHHTSRSRPAG